MGKAILRGGRIAVVTITVIAAVVGGVLYWSGVFTSAEVVEAPALAPAGYTSEQLGLLAVAEEKAGTVDALSALKKLAVQHIAAGQDGLAGDALAAIAGSCGELAQTPGAVHEIVKGAVKEGRGAEIGAVCEALAGQEREGGVWMGMGEVLAGVYGGDDAVVDAGTDRLVERYGADERCVEAMGQIAYAFRQVKKFERAGQYYQYVVDTWPHGKRAVFSVRGLVWMREALGDAAGAGAALDKLLVEYKDDADFVECVRPLADSFEQKKDYNTAIRIHQYVSDNRPGDGMAVWSQFKVFKIALAELKDETLARGAYNRVVERFGGHGRIAQVMCEAAWEYRKLNRHAEAMGPDNIVFCRTALHYRYERPHY